MGNRLYVGNLSYDTTEADLRDLFAQVGAVVDLKVMTDRETGRARGFAFVEMSSQAESQDAISQFNGRELAGRTLKVNEAEDRGGGAGRGRR
jgi:cold-inducible RNA-binding protein